MFSKSVLLAMLASSLLLGSGCSMCCGVYDYDYPTYGGLVPRMDRSYGRAGSVFSDPNAPTGIPVAQGVQEVPESSDYERDFPESDSQDGELLPMPGNNRSDNPDQDLSPEEMKRRLLDDVRSQSSFAPPQSPTMRSRRSQPSPPPSGLSSSLHRIRTALGGQRSSNRIH